MAADQGLIDSVANENHKVGAGGPAFWLNGVMGAYGASTQAILNANSRAVESFNASMGRLVQSIVEEDPTDAVSKQKILTGNDLASQLSSLAAAIAQIQQSTKIAQTTPPQTGAGG